MDEIEQIRDIWVGMQPSPLADIDYFLVRIESRPKVVYPYVVLLERDGHPVTMIIGFVEKKELLYRLGSKVILRPIVHSLRIIDGGILGDVSSKNCHAIISELINSLRRGEADLLYFNEISMDSEIYRIASTLPSFFSRDHFPVIQPHFKMTLPPSIDDFYKARSSKKRTYLRSLYRRLEKSYPGNVKIDIIQEEVQVEQFCKDAEEISKMTYQFKKGEGFVNNTETQMLLKLLAKEGKLRGYILYVEDEPCAYWIGYIHNNNFYGPPAGTGYNPEFGKYEVGTILLLKMIEDLCNYDQVQYIDFGVLDAYYKRRFCDINWDDASFYIFQPSIKGIGLNSLWILFRSIHWSGNFILDSLKLRQRWRKFTRTF